MWWLIPSAAPRASRRCAPWAMVVATWSSASPRAPYRRSRSTRCCCATGPCSASTGGSGPCSTVPINNRSCTISWPWLATGRSPRSVRPRIPSIRWGWRSTICWPEGSWARSRSSPDRRRRVREQGTDEAPEVVDKKTAPRPLLLGIRVRPKTGGGMGGVTRDAEGGEAGREVDVMIEQGNLLLEHGDLDGAEDWYRRAAAGGHTGAMHNLGFVLGEKGDLDGAEDWFRLAAAGGHVSSLSNLGSGVQEKGDLEGAEAWYLQAARGGNAYAMSNLGLLLAERGDARDAAMWYRRAATMGNTGAMHNLGCLLKGVGDLDGAEEWFRYSVDGGNTSSMISLGLLRQDR